MSDIFLSYASLDRALAKTLVSILSRDGRTVFWDSRIRPGSRYANEIRQELNNARCLVVIWTEHSASSDWVLDEAEIGKRRNILVPVAFDSTSIPVGFGQIQTYMLKSFALDCCEAGLQDLLAAVDLLLGRANNVYSVSATSAECNQFYAKILSKGFYSAVWKVTWAGQSVTLQRRQVLASNLRTILKLGIVGPGTIFVDGECVPQTATTRVAALRGHDIEISFQIGFGLHVYPAKLEARRSSWDKHRLTIAKQVVFDEF